MLTRSWRGPGPGRPALPLPPGRMPLVRGGRPLKRWSYVGAYGPELMLCAARGRIGVVPFAWWAVWDRERGRLVQRTARGRGGVEIGATRLAVHGRKASLELSLDDGEPIEVVSPHGDEYVWTRKRGGVAARGWIELDGGVASSTCGRSSTSRPATTRGVRHGVGRPASGC